MPAAGTVILLNFFILIVTMFEISKCTFMDLVETIVTMTMTIKFTFMAPPNGPFLSGGCFNTNVTLKGYNSVGTAKKTLLFLPKLLPNYIRREADVSGRDWYIRLSKRFQYGVQSKVLREAEGELNAVRIRLLPPTTNADLEKNV